MLSFFAGGVDLVWGWGQGDTPSLGVPFKDGGGR